jgi:hypothetical protein
MRIINARPAAEMVAAINTIRPKLTCLRREPLFIGSKNLQPRSRASAERAREPTST